LLLLGEGENFNVNRKSEISLGVPADEGWLKARY
jgi:hypothetical protein